MTINDTGIPISALQQLQTSTYVHGSSNYPSVDQISLQCRFALPPHWLAIVLGDYYIFCQVLDWFLLLEDEVEYTWSGSWNLGTYLFFLTRYGGFVDAGLTLSQLLIFSPSSQLCFHRFRAAGVTLVLGMIIVEATLTLRVWAMWDKGNKVGCLLFASFLFCTIIGISLFVMASAKYEGINNLSRHVDGCFAVSTSKLYVWCFGALMFHQTFIFFMTLVRCVQHVSVGSPPFIRIFYLQGIMYYVILQVLCVVAIIIVATRAGLENMTLILSVQRVAQSVLCVGMLLHIRQVSQIRTIDTSTPVPSATSVLDLPD